MFIEIIQFQNTVPLGCISRESGLRIIHYCYYEEVRSGSVVQCHVAFPLALPTACRGKLGQGAPPSPRAAQAQLHGDTRRTSSPTTTRRPAGETHGDQGLLRFLKYPQELVLSSGPGHAGHTVTDLYRYRSGCLIYSAYVKW